MSLHYLINQLTSCLASVLCCVCIYLNSPAYTLNVGDGSWVWASRSWILAGITLEIDVESRATRVLIAAVSVSGLTRIILVGCLLFLTQDRIILLERCEAEIRRRLTGGKQPLKSLCVALRDFGVI